MICILTIAVGFIAAHFFKMLRLYLVLMEHRISFGRFILLYLRTTFINLIIPFKLGELYRIEEIARVTKIWQVGFLSVLVDRFFDTLALLCVLLPLDLILRGGISVITIVFLVALFVIALVYLAIPASYTYLNRYLIMRKTSGRALVALRGLDIVKSWYDFTHELITGRSALIVAASFLGWGAEIITLRALSIWMHISFGLGDFASYIEAVLLKGESSLLETYTRMGAIALLILTILGYVSYLLYHRKERA